MNIEWAVKFNRLLPRVAITGRDGHVHGSLQLVHLRRRFHAWTPNEETWWNVYCFAVPEHAAEFRARFGGETFDPADRGRGANWARWRRK
jgi:hypothetical protein